MKSEIIRVGKKFVIVLPKDIRTRLNIKEGDLFNFRVEKGKIILEPKRSDPFKTLEKVIREPYDEERDEKLTEEWLKKCP